MKDGLHIDDDGNKYWYKNGLRHRNNDLPACEFANGTKYWYQHGKLHRDNDLPAMEGYDGTKCWYKNDNAHRIGNPTIIYNDSTERFYINDKRYSEKCYWKEVGKNYGLLISNKVKI